MRIVNTTLTSWKNKKNGMRNKGRNERSRRILWDRRDRISESILTRYVTFCVGWFRDISGHFHERFKNTCSTGNRGGF
jgi:hypothetical protein